MSIFDKLLPDKLESIAKAIAKKGAPLLASVVKGSVAGPILSLAAEALGVDSDDPDDLEKAITNDPQANVKLKEIQNQHKVELQKLAIETAKVEAEREKTYLADRQDARAREIAIVEATGKKDWTLYALAWTVVIGFLVLIVFLMRIDLPPNADGYINQLFGALATGFGMVLAYFFGSSKGSSDKSAHLAAQSLRQAAAPTITPAAAPTTNPLDNAKG